MAERRVNNMKSSSSSNPMMASAAVGDRKKFEIDERGPDPSLSSSTSEPNFDMLLKHRARMPSLLRLPPPKTTLAAGLMLLVGTIFLVLGLTTFLTNVMGTKPDDRDRGLAMIVLGSLMFVPGSYASTVLYGAYRGWPGYEYNQIPSYDDD